MSKQHRIEKTFASLQVCLAKQALGDRSYREPPGQAPPPEVVANLAKIHKQKQTNRRALELTSSTAMVKGSCGGSCSPFVKGSCNVHTNGS